MLFIEDLLGCYLDASHGVGILREQLLKDETEQLERLKRENPDHATMAFLDAQPYSHGFEAGNDLPAEIIHVTTRGEFKSRSAETGRIQQLLGFMMITFLFSAWEDRYRARFAQLLGYSKKEELLSDVFGDIRHLRNAIVHNHGRVTEEVTKGKTFQIAPEGSPVFVSRETVHRIYSFIDVQMENWSKESTCADQNATKRLRHS